MFVPDEHGHFPRSLWVASYELRATSRRLALYGSVLATRRSRLSEVSEKTAC
ncbi:hypothetical protein SAMN05660971_02051, partial [Halomonas cupida]